MAVDFRLRGWVIGKVSRPRLYIFRQICKYKTTNNRMYVCLYDKRALRHLLIFLNNKKQKRKIKQNKKNSHEERLVLQKNTFRHSCLQNLRRYVLVFLAGISSNRKALLWREWNHLTHDRHTTIIQLSRVRLLIGTFLRYLMYVCWFVGWSAGMSFSKRTRN